VRGSIFTLSDGGTNKSFLLLIPPFQTIYYHSTLLWDVTSVAEGNGTALSRRPARARPSQVVRFKCVEAIPGRANDEPRDLGVPVQLLQVVLPLDAHPTTPSQHGTQHHAPTKARQRRSYMALRRRIMADKARGQANLQCVNTEAADVSGRDIVSS
jgi:hypothetical protein